MIVQHLPHSSVSFSFPHLHNGVNAGSGSACIFVEWVVAPSREAVVETGVESTGHKEERQGCERGAGLGRGGPKGVPHGVDDEMGSPCLGFSIIFVERRRAPVMFCVRDAANVHACPVSMLMNSATTLYFVPWKRKVRFHSCCVGMAERDEANTR
jgi:hypothetical protein